MRCEGRRVSNRCGPCRSSSGAYDRIYQALKAITGVAARLIRATSTPLVATVSEMTDFPKSPFCARPNHGYGPLRVHPDQLRHVYVAAFSLPEQVYPLPMSKFRIAEVAELLGVSDDTVRRWIDGGRLPVERDQSRRMVIDGATLAAFAQGLAHPTRDTSRVGRSARNHFVGLVTNVITDTVMTQIELQCGPHRIVSLMSTEAARELGLEPGSLAVAVVKSTQVLIEVPSKPPMPMPEDAETTPSPSVEASG